MDFSIITFLGIQRSQRSYVCDGMNVNAFFFKLFILCAAIICYDDACHLKKFCTNPKRSDLTEQSKQLAQMSMAVDKMHMRGHIDAWCKENCDPKKFSVLDKVSCAFRQCYYFVEACLFLGGH